MYACEGPAGGGGIGHPRTGHTANPAFLSLWLISFATYEKTCLERDGGASTRVFHRHDNGQVLPSLVLPHFEAKKSKGCKL